MSVPCLLLYVLLCCSLLLIIVYIYIYIYIYIYNNSNTSNNVNNTTNSSNNIMLTVPRGGGRRPGLPDPAPGARGDAVDVCCAAHTCMCIYIYIYIEREIDR